jgi:hypothetical protein
MRSYVMNNRQRYITNMIISRPKRLINDGREWLGAALGPREICDGGLE